MKKNLTQRLSHIEGQIRALNRMVDEDIYCDDSVLDELDVTIERLLKR